MADAVGIITTAVELALKIKDAVDTVRQNREDCALIRRRVERVRHTLSLCEGNAELMASPAVRAAVEALAEVLGGALELVTGCQEETSAVCLCYSAGKLSKQLGKVDRGISDGNSEATFAILVYHISKQTRDGSGAGPATSSTKPQRGSSAAPKFGDWDEDPSTGEGFTHIFNKVREDKPSRVNNASSSHTYTGRYNQGDDRYESSGSGHGGGKPSECEEDDGALLQEIARVTLAIRTAMETVRQNKDECLQIDKLASRVNLILSQLEHTETKEDTAVRQALKSLRKAFRHAHKLVLACQRRHVVVLCSPEKLSRELRSVLDEIMLGLDHLIDALL